MGASLEDLTKMPNWPLHLSDVQAAAYFGVGVTTFNKMVENSELPKPTWIGSRKLWFRPALDVTGRKLAICALGTVPVSEELEDDPTEEDFEKWGRTLKPGTGS